MVYYTPNPILLIKAPILKVYIGVAGVFGGLVTLASSVNVNVFLAGSMPLS